MSRPHRIDTHQHIVPPGYARWTHQKGIRPGGLSLPSWSERSALKFMDRNDVQTGILSLSTPGVYLGGALEARRRAREVNEYTAEVVDGRPDRFGFFATLT
jgi:predicted TIM-barrel fold metal-dependent hydrolase